MKIQLQRKKETDNSVLGELSIDGKFFCYTLEDKIRQVKIKHQTCIPPGTYEVKLTMSQRFNKILPILLDVPNFEGIRIHTGNTIEDTSGCILVGTAIADDKLLHSKVAMSQLQPKIQTALKTGKVEIEVINPVKIKEPEILSAESLKENFLEPQVPEKIILPNTSKFTLQQWIQLILTYISKIW